MVLLAAAVCTRNGKPLLSRQFVEMTRARIEGLLAAFPKLMPPGVKQHTFVETDSVRYVYQPIDRVYVVLITTKMSNILEDLETLRLFARVVPEFSRTLEESDILENSCQIIFAFDEIVALGYRESVNLAQIRTFVEMDSHEEKVYLAVRQTQEREANQRMREKAKELQRARMEAKKAGGRAIGPSGGFGSGSGGGGFAGHSVGDTLSTPAEPPKPTFYASSSSSSRKPLSSKAMKLGGKTKDVDSFVDQLKSEGEHVASDAKIIKPLAAGAPPAPQMKREGVHASLEEKITVLAGRDGGLESMELFGMLMLRIGDAGQGHIKLQLNTPSNAGIQLQTHPNVDKDLLKSRGQIALKNPTKPFPANTDVGVLKWRFTTKDESFMPLSINCWPSENGQGGCDVNIEYELEVGHLELKDVVISIPIPHGVNPPVVSDCDGDYTFDKRAGLQWRVAVIDSSNKSGSMEFSCGGSPDDFFPVSVSFYSDKTYSEVDVLECFDINSGSPVKYSSETAFLSEKYEIA